MKTLEQVQNEIGFGDVMPLSKFRHYVKSGFFTDWDGSGVFHDGENETQISVWSVDLFDSKYDRYPYVCWYNK